MAIQTIEDSQQTMPRGSILTKTSVKFQQIESATFQQTTSAKLNKQYQTTSHQRHDSAGAEEYSITAHM